MNNIIRIDTGIDTFEASLNNLEYIQVDAVYRKLRTLDREAGRFHAPDKQGANIKYKSRALVSQGLNQIRTYQSGRYSNGISVAVNPDTLEHGAYRPPSLYDPTTGYAELLPLRILDRLEAAGLKDTRGTKITEDTLSVSQVDVTYNLWYDDDTDLSPMLNLFYKGNMPAGFQRRKGKPYFCISAGYVAVKAYDKVQQLDEHGLLPPELAGKKILRIEVSMKREKLVERLGIDRGCGMAEILTTAYQSSDEIIEGYLRRLFPSSAEHLTYDQAMRIVGKQAKSSKRERMLFLMEAAGRGGFNGLDAAIDATVRHFGLQYNQLASMWQEFDRIGVNPVTLPNKSGIDRIANIRHMIGMYRRRISDECLSLQSFIDLDERMKAAGRWSGDTKFKKSVAKWKKV